MRVNFYNPSNPTLLVSTGVLMSLCLQRQFHLAVVDTVFLLIGHYNKYADDKEHAKTTIIPIL